MESSAGPRELRPGSRSASEYSVRLRRDAENRCPTSVHSDNVREIESTQPAFIPTLFVPTCIAYYQHPEVLIGLGLEPRPPHPKGYDLDPGNLEALERVRRRGKRYRDAP